MLKSRSNKIFIIALITLLTLTTMLFTFSIAHGQEEVKTYPYLVVTPNPVGVGQSVFIAMWIHGTPPTAAGLGGHRYNFTLEVKKPTEDFDFIYPPGSADPFFISDETGSAFTQYTPDSLGEYEFRLTYVGQIISRFNPETGIPGFPEPYSNLPNLVGSKFLPSETTEKLIVQQQPLPDPITDYPLPEEYWTHPIEGQNTNWWEISSNWLAGAHIGYNYGSANLATQDLFQPDGTAPNSPHMMWTKPIEFGGIVGGTTEIPGIGFYSGGSYEGRFANAIIMSGRLYYQLPLYHSGGYGGAGYACVDLRTGETIWVSDEIGLPEGVQGSIYFSGEPKLKGQLYNYETFYQHGVVGGLIWAEIGSNWTAYDAYTGQWVCNLTDVPVGTEVYTKSGEIERYVLDYPNRKLSLWTSSATPGSPLTDADSYSGPMPPEATSGAFMYRAIGKSVDMSDNIKWSVTIPDLPGDGNPTIIRVIPDDLILGTSTNFPLSGGISRIPPSIITMWAINLDENRGDIGAVLWLQDIPSTPDSDPPCYLTRRLGPVDPINRIFTMTDVQDFTWWGYDLDTGALMWGPAYDEHFDSDYQYYGSGLGGGQKGFVAYDRLYVQGYGGAIHCYDITDGSLEWKYNNTVSESSDSGLRTIWGELPIFIAGIADGKVYVFNNERSPSYPLYKGERVRCLDAYTGDEIWTLMGMAGQHGYGGESTAVIADGFLCYYNYYDNQIYCLGKGPTETTVECDHAVSNNPASTKQSVLVKGSVTDLAPGTMQDEQAKRFPHGVPAVSEDSMGPWMEYVYMQKPCPEEVTGVEVKLTAIDSNDNYYEIGTAKSESSGVYGFEFTPPASGLYRIIATFQGSDSYWPSSAETFLLVEETGKNPKNTSSDTDLELGNSVLIIGLIAIGAIIGGRLLVFRGKDLHWSK
jgi:hypothetical protein